MKLFKDRFLGKSCVIFGNGPSLTQELIDQINNSNIASFAANGFCLTFDKSSFRPTFVCMSNYSAIDSYGHLYPDKVVKFFKAGWREASVSPKSIENVHELPFLCSHDLSSHGSLFIKDRNFTLNPFKENFCGDTVLLDFAIPLAYYMGFNRVILCGVDTDYSQGYFDSNYITANHPEKLGYKSMSTGDYSIVVSGYKYCHEFFKSNDRILCKLTESKRLGFIEKINIF